MPELPEVQTIVNDLNKKIKGDLVVDFWTDWGKAIKNITTKDFKKSIKNKKVIKASRIGKNIFIELSGGKTLYIHLKMTGHLLVKTQETRYKIQTKDQTTNNNVELRGNNVALRKFQTKIQNSKSKILKNKENYFEDRVNQYIHHVFYLSKSGKEEFDSEYSESNSIIKVKRHDKTIEFSDLRKFGKIMLVDTNKVKDLKEIKVLGIDAMSRNFTFFKFKAILEKQPKRATGLILMDQNLIAGIGNIYRSEILFEAGVSPKRLVKNIEETEKKKIYQAIKKVLKKAIKLRGTSDSDYRDTSGVPGNFQKVLKVYRRDKQECKKCGIIIKRIKMGQRSVFLCSSCQR